MRFPSGTCLAGPDLMPQGTEHFGGNQGSLADAGYGARIAGVASLENNGQVEIQASTPYGLTIEATTDDPTLFWGYFFRVSSPGDSISRAGSIGVPASDNDDNALQILESDGEGITRTDNDDELPAVCASAVAGASHVNVDVGRDQITAILDVGEPGEIQVEVVIMMSEQEWYYTSYTVNVIAAAPTDTSSVVSPAPTPDDTSDNNNAAVVAAAPTDTPVAAPMPNDTSNNNEETTPTTPSNNDTTSAAAMEHRHYYYYASILIAAYFAG